MKCVVLRFQIWKTILYSEANKKKIEEYLIYILALYSRRVNLKFLQIKLKIIFQDLYFFKKLLYILTKLIALNITMAHFIVIESKKLSIYIKNVKNFDI